MGLDSVRPAETCFVTNAPALTPTLSRVHERGQDAEQSPNDSLSRERERAGVRARARALRHNQTDAEALLWSKLRSRQIGDLKFRRQHPVGPYFADFACIELGFVIELDGGQHGEAEAMVFDEKRASHMAGLGFQTLRFWNNDVLLQTEAVLEKILQFAGTLTPTLSRSREREQEPTEGTTS
jgi:very-short-patch-repair endonuclease